MCEDERKILVNKNQELQKELEAIKVSFACMHPCVQLHHILLLVAYK